MLPLLLVFALAFGQVDASHPPPGFVPPVLKGVQPEGHGRHARGPIPFPDPKEAWIRVRTPHFDIISSAGEKRTREMAEHLETLAAALNPVQPRLRMTEVSTRVFLFTRRRESQPYFDLLLNTDHAAATGVYVSQKSRGSMLIDASSFRSDRTPYHELIHELVSSSETRPPLWLEEGLAEYFSNVDIGNGVIRAGTPIREHMALLERGHLMPLRELFTIAHESEAGMQPGFYAESWAAVDWLMRANRAAFYDFLDDLEHGATVDAALKSRYGKSVDDLQRNIDSYGRSMRPLFAMKIPVENAAAAINVAPIDRAELLYQLGNFLSSVEDSNNDMQRHYLAALEANPHHARTLGALGRFDDAIAADPNDAELYLMYAETLMESQLGSVAESTETSDTDVAPFRKARALAEKAVAIHADGRALGDLGTSYVVEKDAALAPGIEALEKAHALLPARNDFTMHLFAFYRRLGDRARADPLLAQLERARSAQVAFAAHSVILRVELARANALVQQQKLPEAAAVVRDLAANTPDPDGRKDLERQAAEIDRVAEINKQISEYNHAISLVNSGRYREASKALDALLQTAKDPGVIRDAQKLQKQLAHRR